MLKKVGAIAIAVLSLLPCLTWAQDGRSQVSANLTGDFSKESSGGGVTVDPTQSAGFVGSYSFFFLPSQAVEVNYGYTRNTQKFSSAAGSLFSPIQAGIHEITGAYMIAPRRSAKFSPFLLAGGGVLFFSPMNVENTLTPNAGSQSKGAFLYGGGVDYKLSTRFAVRLQYRGLAYKAPDFGVSLLSSGAWGHIAEPSVGGVFNF